MAKQGMGSGGLGPEEVLKRYEQQRTMLGAIANAEEGGVPQSVMAENLQGSGELLAAIGKAFPQINDTGSGKDRAALVRRVARGRFHNQGGAAGAETSTIANLVSGNFFATAAIASPCAKPTPITRS